MKVRSGTPRPVLDGALRAALPVAVLAIVVIVWQLYADQPNNYLTPGPARFLSVVPEVLSSREAWTALGTSDLSLLIGYAIAIAIGVPLGMAMARVRIVDRVAGPYLDIAIVVPMAVMMPVVLMALGLTRTAQVAVIILFALPFIVTATRGGVRTLPPEWTDMARSFGAREIQLWRRVLLPGSISPVITGLRLGFAQALTGLVTVELTLIALGVGKQMIAYQSHFQSAQLFVFVAVLIVQSVVIMSGLRLLELRVASGRRGS